MEAVGGKEDDFTTEDSEAVCFYYNTPGGCWNEGKCRFRHIRDDGGIPRPLCRFFGTKQGCWYGSDCYFTHVEYVNPKQPTQPEAGSPARQQKILATINEELTDANNNDVDKRDDPDDPAEPGSHPDQAHTDNTEQSAAAKNRPWQKQKKAKKRPRNRRSKKGKMAKNHQKLKDKKQVDPEPEENRTEKKDAASRPQKDASVSGEKDTVGVDPGQKDAEQKDVSEPAELPGSAPRARQDSEDSTELTYTKDLKCGECGQMFVDTKDGEEDTLLALEEHYLEMLGKADRAHTRVFHTHPRLRDHQALCGACGRIFWRVDDLLRHLGSKYRVRRDHGSGHRGYFSEIAHQFIERDIGLSSDDEDGMAEYLAVLVCLGGDVCPHHHDDSDEDDSEGEIDTGLALFISHQLKRAIKLPSGRLEAESEERASNHGFTEDEVYELMCQGIKPWESEACAALNVIYGLGGDDIEDYAF